MHLSPKGRGQVSGPRARPLLAAKAREGSVLAVCEILKAAVLKAVL